MQRNTAKQKNCTSTKKVVDTLETSCYYYCIGNKDTEEIYHVQ